MSRLTKLFPFTPFFFLTIGLLLSQMACSPQQQAAPIHALAAVSNGVDTALTETDELVFAGQVEDENGRWLNNRVVILFKHDEEVARGITDLRETSFSNEGPMDGVFEIRISNEYKLSTDHEFNFYSSGEDVSMKIVPGVVGNKYLGTWFDDLNPSDFLRIHVTSKQLEYALVVLPMPLDELPETHLPGKLRFQDGMLVIPVEETENEEAMQEETAVPLPSPESDIQFTLLPPNGEAWNLQMTGYYGNRWDVWEKYVTGRGTGMSWETFKVAVLSHNPQLEEDGYVFYPDKSYLLPTSQ